MTTLLQRITQRISQLTALQHTDTSVQAVEEKPVETCGRHWWVPLVGNQCSWCMYALERAGKKPGELVNQYYHNQQDRRARIADVPTQLTLRPADLPVELQEIQAPPIVRTNTPRHETGQLRRLPETGEYPSVGGDDDTVPRLKAIKKATPVEDDSWLR